MSSPGSPDLKSHSATYQLGSDQLANFPDLLCVSFSPNMDDNSTFLMGFLGFCHNSVGKESFCKAGDPGSIPGWGRPPGEGISYPLQYSWASLVVQLVKNLPAMRKTWFDPWVGKIPWSREQLPPPEFWPGEFHGLYSPWGCKESDTAEWFWLTGFLCSLSGLIHRLRLMPDTSQTLHKCQPPSSPAVSPSPLWSSASPSPLPSPYVTMRVKW